MNYKYKNSSEYKFIKLIKEEQNGENCRSQWTSKEFRKVSGLKKCIF